MPAGVQEAVGHYLERWDGKGPYGLAGDRIPPGARLHIAMDTNPALFVEAVLDFLVEPRASAPALPREQAREERRRAGQR